MASITFIYVGSLKESYLKEAVAEYKKRLSLYAKIDEIELKEETVRNEDNKAEIKKALESEGEKILSAIPKGAWCCALCVEGKQYASEELAELVKGAVDKSGRLVFIIGSSHGLCDSVKAACDTRLSISKLTFPHQLIRPVILEAVYRSFTIIAGKRYHK